MSSYRERLWPAAWMYLVIALIVPATMLVFTPISLIAGVITAVALVAACVGLLIASAPTIAVEDGLLRAGRASIPLDLVGDASAAHGEQARHERGPGLDARAHLVLRGWVDPVLRVEILDPDDPAPYWLVSTRRPEQLAAAIEAERAARPSGA
ncbi:DUF3093 domain-containing protein [Yonghaparkia sp. Root332]|uniref:DUF3093 domain-containing protein n=1 Tax=Yonghaparkia sp. Root332 TaxID=1736516 RepID=UPI0006FB9C79|nr:DUF3093 domain-containing protein [Yonghaparkia sp. Root332]KQV24949.1 hypothetical protein ASC54_10740 [Yonghaparkia sp. Root332]